MLLFTELKRRNVFRVGAAYLVVAWLLVQVSATLFPLFGWGDSAVRNAVILLAIGFIPTLIFAWVFELTPGGLKRESDVDRSQSITPHTGKKLDRAILLVLALALGYFAFDKFVLSESREITIAEEARQAGRTEALVGSYGESSIAVLPFVNMSDDAGNEYFSDGIAEELLNLLARIPRLRVISKSSSFSFKGKDFTIPQVAEQLNVGFVLEGSVRKFGNKVRITAQLIEARSDTHLWSETYDRTLDDLFAIQDEISAAIVAALKSQLKLEIGAVPKAAGTANAEAHDAVLRGRYLVAQRKPRSPVLAVAEFEKAVLLDPDFALAHAELAIALLLGGCGDVTDTECSVRAESHVEKAMALDPTIAEAHAAKAWLTNLEGRDADTLKHFQRAIEINPNYSLPYAWMVNWHLFNSHDEAFAALEMALRLDPLHPLNNHNYIYALLARNRLEEAAQQIERYASIDPKSAMVLRGSMASLGGNWADYILAYLEAANGGVDDLTFGPTYATHMMWHLGAIGLEDEALRFGGHEDILALTWLGNPQAAITLAKAQDAGNSKDFPLRANANFALAHAGQYAEARPFLEEIWNSWGPLRGVPLNWWADYLAQALVAALRDAGDEAEAKQVLEVFKDWVRSNRDAGITLTQWRDSADYLDGIAAYLEGERDAGLALMAQAAEDGYWVRPPAAFQQAMYQDPGFAPILARQAARQARERAKLLAVVCNDNPYAAVWQPTEETCLRYSSAGKQTDGP